MYPVRWLVILLALSAILCAQTGVKLAPRDAAALIPPKTAVRRYCEMDAQGFRLTPETARRIQAVTNVSASLENHSFDVISQYDITSVKPNARGVLVTVEYSSIGHFEPRVGFAPDQQTYSVEFQAVLVDDDWRVAEGDALLKPHVIRAHAVRWLRDQAGKEKDPDSKHSLDQALKLLS